MAQLIADSSAVGGIAFVTANGVSYRLVGNASYSPAEIEREPALGMDGVHGYIEKPRISSIKGRFRDDGNLTVGDFQNMAGITVVLELVTGKVVSGSNMWTAAAAEVDAAEGTFDVEWQCGGGLTEELAGV